MALNSTSMPSPVEAGDAAALLGGWLALIERETRLWMAASDRLAEAQLGDALARLQRITTSSSGLSDEDRRFLREFALQLMLWENTERAGRGTWRSLAAHDLERAAVLSPSR